MANRVFGEARLPLADGVELTLRFDFAALVEAEEAAERGTDEMMKEMAAGGARLKTARAMLYGALRQHHPELTLDEAGDLFLSDGEAVSAAMGRAMSEMSDRKPNPPQGAAAKKTSPRGTGTRSSKSGVKSPA